MPTSIRIANITLAKGNHDDCDDPEGCLFEWYNLITRQVHTDDRPPGVSPVLHIYGMRLNDALADDRRQELKRYLPNGADVLAGTADDGKDETRSLIALDWLIRTHLPAWLDLAGLADSARDVGALPRIDDRAAAETAGPVVRAAGDAAGDAAGAAAWAAARAAAGDAAWDAARAAARDAAWAAARAAARDAAGAALDPTVKQLQASALLLVDRMIEAA